MSTTCGPVVDRPPAGSLGFRATHAALRRDGDRLVTAIRRSGGPHDAVAIRTWFDHVEAMLAHHHQIEDEIWLPTLTVNVAGFADASAALAGDHARLDVLLTDTRRGLEALAAADPSERTRCRQRAALAANELRLGLVGHLAGEEAVVFSALAELPAPTIAAAERRAARRDWLRHAPIAVAWVFDDLGARQPDLLDEAWPQLPRLMRPVARCWLRRYREQYADVLALAA